MTEKIKAKVLFVIHDNYQDFNTFPLGIGYLAAILRENGVDVSIYSQDVFHYSNEQLATYLEENEFDIIGMGFMAPRFKRTVEGVCKVINKHKKNAWVVLGGNGPTPIAKYILEETSADIIALGEAESSIVDIVRCKINGNDEHFNVKGIAYLKDGNYVETPRQTPIKDLGSLPYPAWDLFPMEKYIDSMKYPGMGKNQQSFQILSSRGCVNRCSFCYRMEKGIRTREPKDVIREMKVLYEKYGINYFHFADELSVVSKKQIRELTQLINQNFEDINFRMECRVSMFDKEIAGWLKEAGCNFLNIGFESSSQEVLNEMQKNATVEQNIKAAEIALEFGIGIGLNMIWGMPFDNEKTLRDNAAFIKKYNHYDQIRTIRPVTPYPGSPLYNLAIQKGLLEGPVDFFEKFKNADLYMCNFMGIPEKEIYEMLLDVNTDLITDHFKSTDNDMKAAQELIDDFKNLYTGESLNFNGPRHYVESEEC